MPITIDPAGAELRALERATSWRGKQVLEIGCGDGRLSLRLASLGAAKIHALDPDAALIRTARKQLPKRYARRVEYRVGHAESVKFPANSFDRVVFAWVL